MLPNLQAGSCLLVECQEKNGMPLRKDETQNQKQASEHGRNVQD